MHDSTAKTGPCPGWGEWAFRLAKIVMGGRRLISWRQNDSAEQGDEIMSRDLVWTCMAEKRGRPLRRALSLAVLCLALLGGPPAWGQDRATVRNTVRQWIKTHVEQPNSYKGLQWSEVVKHQNDGPYAYSVRHVYQAANSAGQPQIFDVIFSFNHFGEIMGMEVLKGDREPDEHRLRP